MKNIILEGANATGKTTTMNLIRKLYPESNFIEFHDFYHEHVFNQLKLGELHNQEHWDVLNVDQKNEINNYLCKRNQLTFDFISKQNANRNIIERLVLTHSVYSKILLNIDITSYLQEQAELFNSSNTVLILVTCDNNILKDILTENIRTREGRNAPTSQYHLKSVEMGLLKNELYNEHFDLLQNVTKHKIINSGNGVEELQNTVITALKSLSV